MKVEGRNSIYELLKTNKEIDKILVQKDLKDDASKRLIISYLSFSFLSFFTFLSELGH